MRDRGAVLLLRWAPARLRQRSRGAGRDLGARPRDPAPGAAAPCRRTKWRVTNSRHGFLTATPLRPRDTANRRIKFPVASLARREQHRRAASGPRGCRHELHRRLSETATAFWCRSGMVPRSSSYELDLVARKERQRDDDAGQQARGDLVARRPSNRLRGGYRRHAPTLDAAGRGRRGETAHLRRRSDAARLVFSGWKVDLHSAEPPEHLARAHRQGVRSSR